MVIPLHWRGVFNRVEDGVVLRLLFWRSLLPTCSEEAFIPLLWRGVFDAGEDGVVYKQNLFIPMEILTHIRNIPIRRNFVENLPYHPFLVPLSKRQRKARILSEVLFWQQVRGKIFHNIDFDRQRIIGNYIVDFYVKTLGLIVEIDGTSHDDKEE